ncbi:hypothetical protein ACN6AT_35990 (plasmid) [Streptomyces sp. JL4002]|uniref:hypothetical protein n=1 Tax=Streptomyces sp. JL4002 TaxID=3404781 RepID=UPI003B28A561
MNDAQGKRPQPATGREKQEHTRRPSQDPVHPEKPSGPENGSNPEREHRREEDLRDWDPRDEDF